MAAILNGRTVSVTDGVALFPRFPHLVEVGRIELPLGVRTTCRDLFPVTPATTSARHTCLCTTVPLSSSVAIRRTDKYCLTVPPLRYLPTVPPSTQAPQLRGQHSPFTCPLLHCPSDFKACLRSLRFHKRLCLLWYRLLFFDRIYQGDNRLDQVVRVKYGRLWLWFWFWFKKG